VDCSDTEEMRWLVDAWQRAQLAVLLDNALAETLLQAFEMIIVAQVKPWLGQ